MNVEEEPSGEASSSESEGEEGKGSSEGDPEESDGPDGPSGLESDVQSKDGSERTQEEQRPNPGERSTADDREAARAELPYMFAGRQLGSDRSDLVASASRAASWSGTGYRPGHTGTARLCCPGWQTGMVILLRDAPGI